jgi:glycosyltransferase 2 family protein
VAFEPIATKWVKAAAISTSVAAAVYLATVSWVGRADVSAALKLVSADTLIALLALSTINYGVRFLRWHYYLHMLGNFISIRHDLRIYIGGFALTTTPGKAGEMARSLWLQPYGVPAASSLAAFFAERIQDFLVILILSSLGASLYPGGKWLLLGSFALVLIALLVLSVPAITQSVLRSIAVHRQSMQAFGRRIADILLLTRDCLTPARFVLGLAGGVCAWSAEALGFYILMPALGHPLPLLPAISIYAFSMLAGALSFMPGGLGGSEAAMIVLLRLSGIPMPIAVSATLLIRLATLWFAVLLGIVALSIRAKIPLPAAAPPASTPAGAG